MPLVPTYGAPKVARDPLSAGKLNAVQSDAGEVVGKAVQGLGDAMQSVGQTAFEIEDNAAKKAKLQAALAGGGAPKQDGGGQPLPIVEATDADRAAALEAQRQADQDAAGISDAQLKFSAGAVQQLGPDGGLTGLQGRDALAAAPQVRQGIGDAFNDAVDSLPPGPARAQGLVALKAQRAGAERLVDGYMADQPAVHLKQSLAARVVGFQQQTAPLYLIDPALAEHNLNQMDLAQRELDLRSGTPLDHHLANQLQNRSTAWSSLAENRIAAGDWRGAQSVLSDRAGELTYADRTRLQPAVTDGMNLADGRAWAEGSLTAGWAGRHAEDGADPHAAPPVGIDPQVQQVRGAAAVQGATMRERERLVAEAITGGLPAQAAAGRDRAGGGEGGDRTDAAVAAALDRDRTAQQLAGRVLGREPDDWQVAFVARQPAPQAGAALLGASRDDAAAQALSGAGVSPASAQTVLESAGAQPGATVGQVLDAARDGYGRALGEAARVASARPQALFTPDHLPDRDAYLALADLAAGPDPARRQAFRAAAATHWQDLSDAQEKRRTDALDAVSPELSQAVPYSKWDPAKQAALDPQDRKAFIDAEAHPAPPEGEAALLADIREIYAKADPAFKTLNPAHLAGLLNPTQFKQFMQWREDVLKNGGDRPTPGQIEMQRTLGTVREATGVGAAGGQGAFGFAGHRSGDPPNAAAGNPDGGVYPPGEAAAQEGVIRTGYNANDPRHAGAVLDHGVYHPGGPGDPQVIRAATGAAAGSPARSGPRPPANPEYDRVAPPPLGKRSLQDFVLHLLGRPNAYDNKQQAFADDVRTMDISPTALREVQASLGQIEAEKRARALQAPTFASGLTPSKIKQVMNSRATSPIYAASLLRSMSKYNISNVYEQAALIAQVGQETGGLSRLDENLSYTLKNLKDAKFWAKYFQGKSMAAYVHNPQALANLVYATQNGNNQPGDGYRYRAKGMLQTTGRANFRDAGHEADPDSLLDPDVAADSAMIYWTKHGIGQLASRPLTYDDFLKVTVAVNGGGANHAMERWRLYQRALSILQPSKPGSKTTP